MATGNQGLGSDNMSQADKDKIHSMGGKASNASSSATSSSTTTNKAGGGGLDKEAQKRGGQNSRRG
jgi:hypothetical protein